MNAPVQDPARAALGRVLRYTVDKKRFPKEEALLRRGGSSAEAIRRLVDDGRYLARLIQDSPRGRWVRIAPTLQGHYEVESPLGTQEVQRLTVVRERLVVAIQRGLFAREAVPLAKLRRAVASDFSPHDFQRCVTVLTSPRLQGRYPFDPVGYCGRTDIAAVPDDRSGFFAQLWMSSTFLSWELPKREPRRTFLLSESGLRVEVDGRGQVHVYSGLGLIVVLPPSVGSNALAALIRHRGKLIHALDLQGCDGGQVDDCAEGDLPGYVEDCLFDYGVEFDATEISEEQAERLAAIVRRIDALEQLARSDRARPRWATSDPAGHRASIIDELKAALAGGPVHADYPLVKNAARVVRRALDETLECHELAPFRGDFSGHERLVYRASD